MFLVIVNGRKCALVERRETADQLKATAEKLAALFNGAAPAVEVENMPPLVMGGGDAAEHQALMAMMTALRDG